MHRMETQVMRYWLAGEELLKEMACDGHAIEILWRNAFWDAKVAVYVALKKKFGGKLSLEIMLVE